MSAPQSQQHKFVWLDFIRGLSAIAVCASHLRVTLFTDYSKLESAGLLQKVFYALTGLGHQSVIVFFVLSGFFVGGSVLRAGDNFKPGSYALARLTRLWIVLIPALILTKIVDMAINLVQPGVLTGDFQPIWASGPMSSSDYSASLLNFFSNLFFLQTVFTPVFGTNGPLWSLANEFWYYVLFPLCAFALGMVGKTTGGSRVFLRIGVGALAVVLLVLLPSHISSPYAVWLLGLPVYFLIGRLNKTARIATLVVGLAAFGVALGYSKAPNLHEPLGLSPDFLIGIGFCILCVALANMPAPRNPRSIFVRASHGMSAFSYSLYLVHFPFVALIGSTLYGKQRMALDAVGLLQFAGWMAVLLAIGAGFWWLFERRTDVLRHAMKPARYKVPKVAPRAAQESKMGGL